jgi:hypothetical protein
MSIQGLGHGAASRIAARLVSVRQVGAMSGSSKGKKLKPSVSMEFVLHNLERRIKRLPDILAANAFAANLTAPNMTVRLTPSNVKATSTHFNAPPSRKPIALAYGAPGAGKSAYAKTMADLINRYDSKNNNSLYHSTASKVAGDTPPSLDKDVAWLKSSAAMHDVDEATVRNFASESQNTLAVVISFNGRSECLVNEIDAAKSLEIPWLPVALRLLFQCFSFDHRSYYIFTDELVRAIQKCESLRLYFVRNCDPESLMDRLRSKYKKAKVALFVDETMKACEFLTQNGAVSFIKIITALQDNNTVCTFFTGLRSGPFLRASTESGRSVIPTLLPTISENRHDEFFPSKDLHRLIPESVRKKSNVKDVGRVCVWLSRYLFSLTAGYPRMVEILHRACSASETLSEVFNTAVIETSQRYLSGVTSSALAIGAFNVKVPRSLILSDSASQRALLLRNVNNALDAPIPDGYVALDEMVSRGRVFIKDPGESLGVVPSIVPQLRRLGTSSMTSDIKLLDTVTPFVPPLNLLANFRERVALADIRAASELVSELLAEFRKDEFSANLVHALTLAARRRLELLPPETLTVCQLYIDALNEIDDCKTMESMLDLKESIASKLSSLIEEGAHDDVKQDGSFNDELCTLASDARGMVGDASLLTMCKGIGSNEGYQQTIHQVNSKAMERWHARYECTMRRLYADADRYLPEANENNNSSYNKPDYRKAFLRDHYRAAEQFIAYRRAAQFDWTQPLEMVLGVPALPNFSDFNSMEKAKGKMLVMKDCFAGFELAWVAYRVDDEGKGKAVLFLEQHKMQMGTSPESLSTLVKNLKNALKKAKAVNWDPQNVVYVVKSTRPLPGGSWRGAIHHEKKEIVSSIHNAKLPEEKRKQRADAFEKEAISLFNSTNVVLLCGKDGLGKYLGPMLWGSLTAGDALGLAVSSH